MQRDGRGVGTIDPNWLPANESDVTVRFEAFPAGWQPLRERIRTSHLSPPARTYPGLKWAKFEREWLKSCCETSSTAHDGSAGIATLAG
jgi:hypothetical protein